MPNATPATSLQVRPRSRAVAAEVTGIDLAAAIDDDTMLDLRRAFARHSVLVFPDQHLDPVAQWRSRSMGHAAGRAVPGSARGARQLRPCCGSRTWARLRRSPRTGISTRPTSRHPPPIAILAAQELPRASAATRCGPTSTSPTKRCRRRCSGCCRTLRAAFTGIDARRRRRPARGRHVPPGGAHPPGAETPVAGDRADRVGAALRGDDRRGEPRTARVPLPPRLASRVRVPPPVADGDVVMWDNRCLLHYAIHDHGDDTTADAPRDRHRSLRRATRRRRRSGRRDR